MLENNKEHYAHKLRVFSLIKYHIMIIRSIDNLRNNVKLAKKQREKEPPTVFRIAFP